MTTRQDALDFAVSRRMKKPLGVKPRVDGHHNQQPHSDVATPLAPSSDGLQTEIGDRLFDGNTQPLQFSVRPCRLAWLCEQCNPRRGVTGHTKAWSHRPSIGECRVCGTSGTRNWSHSPSPKTRPPVQIAQATIIGSYPGTEPSTMPGQVVGCVSDGGGRMVRPCRPTISRRHANGSQSRNHRWQGLSARRLVP